MIQCKYCGLLKDEDDECPKCAEDWKLYMHCDECGKDFKYYETKTSISDDYQRFTISDELGIWENWDAHDDFGHFCSLKCMYAWLTKKLAKDAGL